MNKFKKMSIIIALPFTLCFLPYLLGVFLYLFGIFIMFILYAWLYIAANLSNLWDKL